MSGDHNFLKTYGPARGFTLFELLVVMLIISLIAALVMPQTAASLPGVRLKSAARAVAASLRYARSRAVYESTPYVAIFDSTRKFLAVEPIETPLDAAESDGIRKILDDISDPFFPGGRQHGRQNHPGESAPSPIYGRGGYDQRHGCNREAVRFSVQRFKGSEAQITLNGER
jgi:prepilin-type N-terminal cleavage/methylation domain-containing protein